VPSAVTLNPVNTFAYLFTVNKSRGCKLDLDELKDVSQESQIYISAHQGHNSDQWTRLNILRLYRDAVNRKIRNEKLLAEQAYFADQFTSDDQVSDQDIHASRAERVKKLVLSDREKKIMNLLIQGYSYKEISKKLRLSSKELRNNIYQIKVKNCR